MKSIDPGVFSHSYCFSFTPSETSKKLFYYPTWCGRYFCSSDYHIKRDTYPDPLLVYVLDGHFLITYENQNRVVNKGEVFLIDCQQPHYYRASEGLEFIYIHFNGLNSSELCHYIISQHDFIFQGERCFKIGEMLYELIERCKNNKIITAPDFSQMVYQMIMTLLRRFSNEPIEDDPIYEVICYIRENIGKKITLDHLAKRAGLSKFHFSHLFKTETGYSPIEYVISTRLDRAKLLLKTSELSVSQISYEVGYENPGSFINLFTNKEGMSPKTYRKS